MQVAELERALRERDVQMEALTASMDQVGCGFPRGVQVWVCKGQRTVQCTVRRGFGRQVGRAAHRWKRCHAPQLKRHDSL